MPVSKMKATAHKNKISDAADISLPTAEKETGKKETNKKEVKETKETNGTKGTKQTKDDKAAGAAPASAPPGPSGAPLAATAVIPPSKVIPIAPVSASPAPSFPPSVPPSAPSSSSSAPSMDIQGLFQSFPSLTPKDRVTIERFFADNWREHFPPSVTAETPVLKIKLRSDEKVRQSIGQDVFICICLTV